MSTAAGWAIVTISRKDRHRCLRSSDGSANPFRMRCRILLRPARENGWQGGPPARSSTPASLMSCPTRATRSGLAEIPVEGQPAEVVPVRLGGFPVLVDAHDDTIARRLKSQAQPAGPAEQVGRQAMPLRAKSRRIRQEVVLVALLGDGREAGRTVP